MKEAIRIFSAVALGSCIASIFSGAYARAAIVSGMAALVLINLVVWYGDEGDKGK